MIVIIDRSEFVQHSLFHPHVDQYTHPAPLPPQASPHELFNLSPETSALSFGAISRSIFHKR